jgi:hypothetical protein
MDVFISIFAFPIGLLICFGPVLFVWLREEFKEDSSKKPKDRR